MPVTEGEGTLHRINDRLSVALVALLLASPIPFASHGATYWTASAVAIGLIAAVYWTRVWTARFHPRVPIGAFRMEAALFSLFCLALLLQAFPLPLVRSTISLADGTVAVAPTISLSPDDTWLMLMRQVGYGLFWFLVVQVAVNVRRARLLLLVAFAMISTHAIYALISLTQLGDTLIGLPKTAYLGFATGTFVNRNSFATFLACGISIGAALLLDGLLDRPRHGTTRQWAERASLALGLGFITAALIATGSRMGLVAAAAGAATIIVVHAVARPTRTVWLAGLALLGTGLIVAIGYGGTLVDRVVGLLGGTDARWALYLQIIEMIEERPWTGFGGGSFAVVFPVFQRPPVDGGFIWDLGHSTYLSLWAELGILAGSLPILIVAGLAVRIARSAREPSNLLVAAAALGSTTAFGLHALVDFSLEIQANAYLFLFTLGIAAGRCASGPQRDG